MTQDATPPTSNLQPPTSNLQLPTSPLRWWGWGTLDQSYDLSHRPNFWPLVHDRLGVSGEVASPTIEFDTIPLPDSRLPHPDLSDLRRIFGEEAVRVDRLSRVVHAYGKSFRDLIRIRRGEVTHPPDAVVYPTDEAQIVALFVLAAQKHWHIIPFGGGSSVTGGLEPFAPRDALPDKPTHYYTRFRPPQPRRIDRPDLAHGYHAVRHARPRP